LCLLSLGLASPGESQTFDPNTYYQLQARHSGKCLDVAGASTANLATMQQWSCNPVPQPNQLWTILPTGSGTFRIVSANSAKCLDIAGASTANGALVQQYNCNLATYQTNQVFNIVASPTAGFYRIYAANNPSPSITRCFDVASSSTSNGAAVQQWDCAPYWGTNQDWTFVPFVSRQPLTHLTWFGYFGEMANGSAGVAGTLGGIKDHVNTAVFTQFRGADMSAADAAWGVKGKMATIMGLFIYAPRATPTACPAAGVTDIYSNGTSGGLRVDYVNYWNTYIKPNIEPYKASLRMFYLDEPYASLGHWGFCTNEIAEMINKVTTLTKQAGQYPTTPFAVVEYSAWVNQSFPGVDWVGADCYEPINGCWAPNGTQVSYRTILDTLEAGLSPSQKVIVVPQASVVRTPRPVIDPDLNDGCTPPSPAELATTGPEQSNVTGLADYYLSIAAADSRVVGVMPWIGPTFAEGCNTRLWIGAFDIPSVLAKWRFSAKALGFGQH
jgi:hypothetical protein